MAEADLFFYKFFTVSSYKGAFLVARQAAVTM